MGIEQLKEYNMRSGSFFRPYDNPPGHHWLGLEIRQCKPQRLVRPVLIGTLQMGAMKLSNARKSINVTPVDHAANILLSIMQERVKSSVAWRKLLLVVRKETLHLPITVSVPTADFMQNFLEVQLSKESMRTVDEKSGRNA